MGLGEYSLYGLGMTNEQTVNEFIVESEKSLSWADRDEWAKEVNRVTVAFLEGFLEKGVIKHGDGLLDAIRKIEKFLQRRGNENGSG